MSGRNAIHTILMIMLYLLQYSYTHAQVSSAEYPAISNKPYKNITPKTIKKLLQDNSHLQQKKPDAGIPVYKNILLQSQHIQYNEGSSIALIFLGNAYRSKGIYQKALEAYLQSIEYAAGKDTEAKKHLIPAYIFTAEVLKYLGRLNEAADYYFKAIETAQNNSGLSYPQGQLYMDLAGVLQDPRLSLQYYNKAETLLHHMDSNNELGRLLLNKALTFNKLRLYDNSMACIKEAFSLGVKNKDSLLQFRSLTAMASTLLYKKEPRQALYYLEKAGETGKETDVFKQNANLFLWSEAWLQMKDYTKAIRYSQEATTNAQKLQMRDQVAEGHGMLAYIYEQAGQYSKAYKHHKLYKAYKDSIMNENVANNIQYLEARFESSQKDKSLLENQLLIAQQQKKINRNKTLVIAIGSGAVILALLLFFVTRNYRNKQQLLLRQQEVIQLKAMIKGEEKERGRLARELHDGIGGMLVAVNIDVGIAKQDSPSSSLDKIESMLDDVAAEVRKTAHNLMPDILEKHNLKDALTLYCEKMNKSQGIRFQLQIDDGLHITDKETELVLYRIIQELANNIVKHADAQLAEIQLLQYGNKLSITVEDDGKGFDRTSVKKGLGLDNIHYRVKALQGFIDIASVPGRGTTVYVQLTIDN